MPFLTEISVTKLREGDKRGRNLWRVNAPLVYQAKDGQVYTVPEGYETDFASVPRLPLVYLLAGDTAHEAATLHDYLYSTGTVPREKADALFLEAMGATDEPGWRRYMMYAAVRAFGGSHYTTKADERAQEEQKQQEDLYVG